MTDALQWITILAAGGGMAYYALYRDRKEHEKERHGVGQTPPTPGQGSLFDKEKSESEHELTHA